MGSVYFDNHSGTRIDDRVFEEMVPYLKEDYGNAQSLHFPGGRARKAMEKARKSTGELIGAKENEIYFTSCGSEANNLAVKGAAFGSQQKGKHIIVSAVEHFSVLYSAKRLQQMGFEVTSVPVDKYGIVVLDELEKAIRKDTILVSIQHANPEIGTIQPIEEISKIVHENKVLFHTDAVSTAGIIPVDVNNFGVDLLTLAGSQFHGPKGAAALYVRKGVRIIPQIDGGIQEKGRRAGTENIPCIAGLGKACEIAKNEMPENIKKMTALRDQLISELPGKVEHIYLNGHPEQRLPDNINFSIEFIEGEGMLLFLNDRGISITSGSACTSKALKMSHVLSAINVDPSIGQGSVSMTLSKYTKKEDIDYFLSEFPPIVKRLRAMSPLYDYFLKTGNRQVAGPGTDYEHEHEHEESDE